MLPFISLQARLGRKAPSEAIRAEVPVIYVAFDLLALGPGDDADGDLTVEPLLREPLRDATRSGSTRSTCRSAADGGRFARSHLAVAARRRRARGGVRRGARPAQRGADGQGSRRAAIRPGRRGLGWLKMKKALATIDCVVVGVEVGHGKRHGVLSDYTFAVRDEATGKLVNIGKAYSGLTDAEIAEMTALVRGAHDRPVRAIPRRSNRPSSSRSPSTSSSAASATARASASGSRGSTPCGRTRPSTRSTRWRP